MVRRLLIFAATMAFAAAPAVARDLDAEMGHALFNRAWVAAPASTTADDGLGPLFNARTCAACHGAQSGQVVRLGSHAGQGDPVYGAQIQTSSLPALTPEARIDLDWDRATDLRKPRIRLAALAFGPLAADTQLGLRRAPALEGAAALASVPDSEIHALAAKSAHGRIASLTNEKGEPAIGRLGWKAVSPDLDYQVAIALSRDMGLSTSRLPGDSGDGTRSEPGWSAAPAHFEVPDVSRALLVFYLKSIAAPQGPQPNGPGYDAFVRSGCAECHASLHDASGRDLHAYSDLLLHDMGRGLDDGIAEGAAQSSEWRTAPLWNLRGALESGGLLHDGRARSIDEAVRWHGGEADASRRRYARLAPDERAQLIAFLLPR
ncbi:MAG TPA: di-heme oxidoredictase family protein [Rhizomicrobium sp.]|jgi:CxxC motif-containing protein (DUF1111 family)|nr:di-heme oxidoredictase family protein [Rhizomicrobium sp.]